MNILTKNITRFSIVSSFLMLWLVCQNSDCYATITTEIVELKCNKDRSWNIDVNWHYYDGNEKAKYSLITIGMKTVNSGDELITIWNHDDYGFATVRAACNADPSTLTNMLPLNQLPSITCQRGQSLDVIMGYPVCQNPNTCRYYGLLTIDTEDDGENQEQSKIALKQEDKQFEKLSETQSQMPDDVSTVAGDENEPLLSGKQQSGVTDKDKIGILESICSSLGIKYDSVSLKSLKLGSGSSFAGLKSGL